MANPKRGVYDPVGKTLKGACPSVTTRKDQEIDQVVRKTAKESNKLKDAGMP